MKLGIRWKWMTAYLSVGIIVLIFMDLYLGSQLRKYFESSFENRWKRELELTRHYFETIGFESLSVTAADSIADRIGATLDMRITLINAKGEVIGDSEVPLSDLPNLDNHGQRPEVVEAWEQEFGKSKRFSRTINLDLVYMAEPIGRPGSEGIIRVAVPVSEIEESVSQIDRLIWLSSILGFILVLIFGFFVSKPLTAKINEMAQAAKRFSRGDFSTKLEPKSNDEIGELGLALNKMSGELKDTFEQITRERDQLQAILNSMVEGVMVTDMRGKILLSNQSFRQIFNISKSTVNKSVRKVFSEPKLLGALEHALQSKKSIVETIDMNGLFQKSLEAHITILSSDNRPSGAVVVFHDVTRVGHLEKVRRDFVANVSHELRTPLTAIKGYAETLLDSTGLKKKKSKEFLKTILRHSDRMSKLVEDLLVLSKLESVDSEIELEEIDLSEIITSIVDSFRDITEEQNLHIDLELPGEVLMVRGLATEVETVVENLVDNAIKYGGKGEVVRVTAKQLDYEVQVDVSDEGMGIPEEDQPRIFERFYRVDKGRSRTLGGTGLGLSIVKHVIQRHGGRIWVESKVGEGTRFSFTLPRAS